MGEAGLPGFEFPSWYGVWAPQDTPREIVASLRVLMAETMRDEAIVQKLTAQVLEPVVESRDETKRFISADIAQAAALLRSVDFQPV